MPYRFRAKKVHTWRILSWDFHCALLNHCRLNSNVSTARIQIELVNCYLLSSFATHRLTITFIPTLWCLILLSRGATWKNASTLVDNFMIFIIDEMKFLNLISCHSSTVCRYICLSPSFYSLLTLFYNRVVVRRNWLIYFAYIPRVVCQ